MFLLEQKARRAGARASFTVNTLGGTVMWLLTDNAIAGADYVPENADNDDPDEVPGTNGSEVFKTYINMSHYSLYFGSLLLKDTASKNRV